MGPPLRSNKIVRIVTQVSCLLLEGAVGISTVGWPVSVSVADTDSYSDSDSDSYSDSDSDSDSYSDSDSTRM